MKPLPSVLLEGPFTRAAARELGLTDRQLDGRRFVRLYPRVFRHVECAMTDAMWVSAARLALPDDARLTGISRIQQLGLDFGPRRPIRFVVERDHHLRFDGVFLHRTKQLPPTDPVGVTVEAAFVAYCALARVVDAIKVGDWLLHHRHTTKESIRTFALSCLWRDGANEAVWVLDHLDDRSRSLKESETRAILRFAGLPEPLVNVAVDVEENVEVIGDLVFRQWRTVVEYEGSQHQEDRDQYNSDVDRYALLRAADVQYVQVTKERLARPKTLVGDVYRTLLSRGYAGPPPTFGPRWELLFRSVSVAVGPKRDRRRRPAVG